MAAAFVLAEHTTDPKTIFADLGIDLSKVSAPSSRAAINIKSPMHINLKRQILKTLA